MSQVLIASLRRCLLALTVLSLAACGGGGSSSGTDSNSDSSNSGGSASSSSNSGGNTAGSSNSGGTVAGGSNSGSATSGTANSGGSSPSATVPGAPSITQAAAGAGSLDISFTAPASDGGAAITSYTASCAADGNTTVSASGSSSPLLVSGMPGGITRNCTLTANNSVGSSAASAAASATPNSLAPEDLTHLPLGDSLTTTTTPAQGYLYECQVQSGGGGASTQGPWFNADGTTWNKTTKIAVLGSVSWTSSFTVTPGSSYLGIVSNGLPYHTTGTFPIATTDPAYSYDHNPNTIAASSLSWQLPASPSYHSTPTCVGGEVGILVTGARLFNAVDGENRDAGAWEIQDHCQGHPDQSHHYHYHSLSSCVTPADTAGQHSQLVGYAADGFAIYGNLGENGVPLSNADLDVCHGHTHDMLVNGKMVPVYHYHATNAFPYTVGCYRGTPVQLN